MYVRIAPCGAMRGYAGLCGAMRGYAGLYAVLCGAMQGDGVPGDAFDRKSVWRERNNLAVKWGCENGFGRETGLVKTELAVKTGSIWL